MKKLLLGLSMILLSTTFTACGNNTKGSDKFGLSEEGKLYMTTNAEFAPYEYYEGKEIVGIDIDIAKAIADKLNAELIINDIAFDSILSEVSAGKADIALAAMTNTQDRRKNVDFSDTYATAKQVIIVKNDSDIKNSDDLVGKVIGVQLGTTGDIYASDIENVTMERYGKGFELTQALSQGKVDAVIVDESPAKFYIQSYPELSILEEAFADEEYAVVIKKGNIKLVESINKALKELKEEGKLDEIVAKYIKAE